MGNERAKQVKDIRPKFMRPPCKWTKCFEHAIAKNNECILHEKRNDDVLVFNVGSSLKCCGSFLDQLCNNVLAKSKVECKRMHLRANLGLTFSATITIPVVTSPRSISLTKAPPNMHSPDIIAIDYTSPVSWSNRRWGWSRWRWDDSLTFSATITIPVVTSPCSISLAKAPPNMNITDIIAIDYTRLVSWSNRRWGWSRWAWHRCGSRSGWSRVSSSSATTSATSFYPLVARPRPIALLISTPNMDASHLVTVEKAPPIWNHRSEVEFCCWCWLQIGVTGN